MPVRIFNNIPSLNAQRILGINNNRLAQSVERISSGIRINKGADDAAGLAISEALRSDIRALRQADSKLQRWNFTDQCNRRVLSTNRRGYFIRLRELSSQAATGTVGSTERQTIQLEFSALRSEIDRISQTTEFNGQKLSGWFIGIRRYSEQSHLHSGWNRLNFTQSNRFEYRS